MNLYEFEGKQLFAKHGIAIPRGVVIRRGEDVSTAISRLMHEMSSGGEIPTKVGIVVKAQVLSGKRGKGGGIRFCLSADEADSAVQELFNINIRNQYVAAVRIEEKLDIAEEHYLSITYDTNAKVPVLIYSRAGGMDIEDVPEEKIERIPLDIRSSVIPSEARKGGVEESHRVAGDPSSPPQDDVAFKNIPFVKELWACFLQEDARLVEINPLVKTKDGHWIAADAKVALDDDAFYRHEEWKDPSTRSHQYGGQAGQGFEPRTMMGRLPTEREMAVKKIDEGENYYRGTAGKYIEMLARRVAGAIEPHGSRGEPRGGDGDIAILFSGGGASIANMDALIKAGLQPANYTEYSGNPPREKVYQLAKIVLSKPGLRGLWIAGGVANFTNVEETFHGIVDALDEVKPTYPIVVRRAGPFEKEGMQLMAECAKRNGLKMKLFGKETSMSDTAAVLAKMVVVHSGFLTLNPTT